MITHVVCYKPRNSRCVYVELFHSLIFAEKWIALHGFHYDYWILKEIEGFHAETGCAAYNVLKNSEAKEK